MWVLLVILLMFGLVVFVGAPWVPTLKSQQEAALDLLDLKPGQTMLELGCGDGRVLKAAARRGWKAVGYELNPMLALIAWLNTLRYRGQVKVVWGNYWTKSWPDADGIFVFLLPKYMEQLDKKIIQRFSKSVKLVSYAFQIPSRHIDNEREGVYLYKYHAKAR